MTKFLNISTDNTLGGNSPSDDVVSSQKAIKTKIDTKQDTISDLATIRSGASLGQTSVQKSGDTMNSEASLTFIKYVQRKLTLNGNNVFFDFSSVTGGWANSFLTLKDSVSVSYAALGAFGDGRGLSYFFMGGTYDNPHLKFTGSGQFTFKYTPQVGSTNVALITDLDSKLDKLTYEWNNAINFGATGKLCIGKFCCYDSNITIDIDATTGTTYHGTLVIALQNIGTSSGTLVAKVYGDATNTIAPNLYIYKHPANDCLIEVYFSPQAWSKNIIHIRALNLNKDHGSVSYDSVAFDLCTSVSGIPAEATIKPTNALDSKQATLVSGTNIKTINNQSILGSGNINISVADDIDCGTM